MIRSLFIILFLCAAFRLFAQEKNGSFDIVRHLNESQGGFTNTIYRTAFDRYGKCYMATNKGLASYNGTSLQFFNMQDELHNHEIYNLQIKDSLLYFLPLKGGLYYVNYLQEFPVFRKKTDVADVLKDIVLRDSTLHLSTYNYIFSARASNIITKQIYFSGNKNRVYVFENNFYLKSENSFSKFDIGTNKIDSILRNKEDIKTFCVYRGHMFYSYRNYFYSKNLSSNTSDSVRFTRFPKRVLPDMTWPVNDSLFFLVVDQDLLCFNSRTGAFKTVLEQVEVNDIAYHEADGCYYVATQNKGLYILKRGSRAHTRLNTFGQKISYLQVNTKTDYVTGFENGDLLFRNQVYSSRSALNTVVSYRNKLFCGLNTGIHIIDRASSKSLYDYQNTTVKKAILYDSTVYFTTSKSLLKFDLNDFSSHKVIASNHRSYYLQEHNARLYTQSYNTDTLFQIDPATDKVKAIGHLKGQVIRSISIAHTIYFMTDVAHLYRYDQEKLTDLRISDHLFYPVTDPAYFEMVDGQLLIGNTSFCIGIAISDLEKGHYRFRPLYLSIPKYAKEVQVKDRVVYYALDNTIYYFPLELQPQEKKFYSLKLRKKEVTTHRDRLFSSPLGRISLDLETVSYTGQKEVLTCYIISNGKKIRVKKNISKSPILLDSLPIGASHILCFATNDRLYNSELLSIPVYIEDQSTHKIIFTLICYGLGILLIAFLVFRYTLKNIKKQHTLKMELALLEQKVGALLMNPHFVFNALGNIQAFIGSKQFATANTYLLKFSLVIRSYINFMKKGIVTLSNELESIRHFIEFQNIKHEGSLELTVFKAPESNTDVIHIPAFILQPFIENSIKYFKKHKAVLSIELHISALADNRYTITINDNGPGLAKELSEDVFLVQSSGENHEFKSIAFTLQRLKKIHDANRLPFSFSIKNRYHDHETEGLTVTLHLSSLPAYPDEEA